MATVKHGQREDGLTANSDDSALEEGTALDPADFELDERLRTLRFDEWFAMAEDGMPIWVC